LVQPKWDKTGWKLISSFTHPCLILEADSIISIEAWQEIGIGELRKEIVPDNVTHKKFLLSRMLLEYLNRNFVDSFLVNHLKIKS